MTNQLEIQIEDENPFIPDEFIQVGTIYNTEIVPMNEIDVEVLLDNHHAVVHYIYQGREVNECYKEGRWEMGSNDLPRFHVKGKI